MALVGYSRNARRRSARIDYSISLGALAGIACALAGLTFVAAVTAVGDAALAIVATAVALLPFATVLARPARGGRIRRSALPVAFDVRAHG